MALTPVRRKRRDEDQTLFEMYRRTGIQPSRLSLIERALVVPRADEKTRIARALRTTVADLFPATSEQTADQVTPGPAGSQSGRDGSTTDAVAIPE